jgi:hypothetical protein
MNALWQQLAANPWMLAYAAGCITGWGAARRATRYMLGGKA